MNAPLTQKQVRDILDKTPSWASRQEYEVYCQHYQKMVNGGMGEASLAIWHEHYWRKDSTLRKILCNLGDFFDDETDEFRHLIPPVTHPSPFGIDATDADLPAELPLSAPIENFLAEREDDAEAMEAVRLEQMASNRLMRIEQERAAEEERRRRRYFLETGAIRLHKEDAPRGLHLVSVLLIGAGLCAFWAFVGRLLFAELFGH